MEETHTIIEGYLDNTLPAAERQAFETKCLNDAELMQELAFYLSSQEAASRLANDQKKKAWIDDYQGRPPSRRTIPLFSLLAAALFLILALGYGGYRYLENQATLSGIYNKTYDMPVGNITRGMSKVGTLYALGIDQYNNENYDQALVTFHEVITTADEAHSALVDKSFYYRGHSFLNISKADSAITNFTAVDSNHEFKPDADWYTALAYLKLANGEAAINQLEKIIRDTKSPYSKRANTLLPQVQKVIEKE